MQNAPVPVACGACMPPLVDEPDFPIVPCAWAIEMPATNAATAVSVVRVFIICLLGSECRHQRNGTSEQRKRSRAVPGTGTANAKKVCLQTAGGREFPGRRMSCNRCESAYASRIATI